MGRFTEQLTASGKEVRLETMRPDAVDIAKAQCPAIYVPFGSIEWHGYHNPVGLDAIKAHEQLEGLALRVGGVVYPPVFFGAGGGHTKWPHSYMVDAEPMVQIVTSLLHGFERDGYQKVIFLSGHYPNKPCFLEIARQNYLQAGGTMDVLAIIENEAPGVEGDHAAKVETSLMLHLHPDLVDMTQLKHGLQDDILSPDEWHNWMLPEYEDHPNYGLVGIDPRAYASAAFGAEQTERLLDYLAAWVNGDITNQ